MLSLRCTIKNKKSLCAFLYIRIFVLDVFLGVNTVRTQRKLKSFFQKGFPQKVLQTKSFIIARENSSLSKLFSGWNCTPRRYLLSEKSHTPSMIPSSERAIISSPFPSSFKAWWCVLLVITDVLFSDSVRRCPLILTL